MRMINIGLAALALASPLAAQAAAPLISWTISSGDTQFSLSGTGSGTGSIDGATYTFGSVKSPSPTLFVTGSGSGPDGSHFDATLDYGVAFRGPLPSFFFVPLSCSAQVGATCSSPYSAGPYIPPVSASGYYEMGAPNTFLSAAVGNDFPFASCDSDLTSDCGFHSYETVFGATTFTYDATGTTFFVPIRLHLAGDLNGGSSTFFAAIDPVLSLNPDFITQSGFSANAFTIDFGGVGNTSNAAGIRAFAGGVPEPVSWTMMLAGFAVVGASLRRRRVIETVLG